MKAADLAFAKGDVVVHKTARSGASGERWLGVVEDPTPDRLGEIGVCYTWMPETVYGERPERLERVQ